MATPSRRQRRVRVPHQPADWASNHGAPETSNTYIHHGLRLAPVRSNSWPRGVNQSPGCHVVWVRRGEWVGTPRGR
eukprot:2279489-Prymnesium_polylepis.1